MLARATKPKLSLSVVTSASHVSRPSLSLTAPMSPLRSPLPTIPTMPKSPTALNTMMNQRGFTTLQQQPTYTYANHSTSRGILKKGQSNLPSARRQLQFSETPLVHCVTPIEEEDYYGSYRKMSRDERRWQSRT